MKYIDSGGTKKCKKEDLPFGRERGSKWRNFMVLQDETKSEDLPLLPDSTNKSIKVSGLCSVDREHMEQGSYKTLNTQMNKIKRLIGSYRVIAKYQKMNFIIYQPKKIHTHPWENSHKIEESCHTTLLKQNEIHSKHACEDRQNHLGKNRNRQNPGRN